MTTQSARFIDMRPEVQPSVLEQWRVLMGIPLPPPVVMFCFAGYYLVGLNESFFQLV